MMREREGFVDGPVARVAVMREREGFVAGTVGIVRTHDDVETTSHILLHRHVGQEADGQQFQHPEHDDRLLGEGGAGVKYLGDEPRGFTV
jgi:hypothetical protein